MEVCFNKKGAYLSLICTQWVGSVLFEILANAFSPLVVYTAFFFLIPFSSPTLQGMDY